MGQINFIITHSGCLSSVELLICEQCSTNIMADIVRMLEEMQHKALSLEYKTFEF